MKYRTTHKNTKDKPILILIFENKYEKKAILKKTLHKIWIEFLAENPELQTCFNTSPMLAFKNGRSIRNTLTSSKHPTPWSTKTDIKQNKDYLDIINLDNLLCLLMENSLTGQT